MPNWCECDLTVEGPREKVEEFLAFAKTEERAFDFNRFIPYPEHFKEQDRIAAEWGREHPFPMSEETFKSRPTGGYNAGGYEWCCENWGTKWNARRLEVGEPQHYHESSVEIYFNTAWSPPKPVIEAAAERFPELRFELRYFECGMGFNGKFVCERGEVVADEAGDYFGKRGG